MRCTAPTRVATAELSASVPMRTATSSPSSTKSTGRSIKLSATDTSAKRPRNSVTIGSTCSRPNRIGEHAPCAGQKPLARLGETYRARGAVEKSHPEPRFELANRARNGGRRASEAAGGRGETPALGSLHKGCNAIDTVHTVAYNAIIYSNEWVLSFNTK